MNRRFLFLLIYTLLFGFTNAQLIEQDTIIANCGQDSILLDAGDGYETYAWSNGDSTQTTFAYYGGTYTVIAGDSENLVYDTVVVSLIHPKILQNDTTICPNMPFQLVAIPDDLSYLWTPSGATNDSIRISIESNTDYIVEVTDSIQSCYDTIHLQVHPKMEYNIDLLNEICYGDGNGQAVAFISGGVRPYHYFWNNFPSPFDSITGALNSGQNQLRVIDNNACQLKVDFNFPFFSAPNVDIIALPDTVYIQNPAVQFSFEQISSDVITAWEWDFGDETTENTGDLSPRHIYYGVEAFYKEGNEQYIVSLKISNQEGCDTIISKEMHILEADIKVPAVVTPNHDGFNDVFEIHNKNSSNVLTHDFERIELKVMNRYGGVVYSNSNYQNDWGNASNPINLSDGTYFYIVEFYGFFQDFTKKGSLTILGNH